MASPPLLLLLLLLILSAGISSAQVSVACIDSSGYTAIKDDSYGFNLAAVLSSLPKNIEDYGFYNTSVGGYPNRAHAMALCRGDLQLNECRDCVRTFAEDLPKSYPYRKQAVIWDHHCSIRYSNEDMYVVLSTSPLRYIVNQDNATADPAGLNHFKEELKTLMDGIWNEAMRGDSRRKLAAGNMMGRDFKKTFAMVQCSPDLSPNHCSECLDAAISNSDVKKWFGKALGIRILLPSCSIRYERAPFLNESRLKELSLPVKLEMPQSPHKILGMFN